MPELIIDTSTELCLIALIQEGQILSENVFAHANQLSQNLLPSIQEMMKKSNFSLSALSSIALGIGPGSYTGTRVGAAVAKSLAFGLGIGVKPFYSPLAFLPGKKGSFAFVIPTKAGAYFLLKGDQPSLVSSEELEAEAGAVDYLVTSPSHAVPESLKSKPYFEAAPNLPLLVTRLDAVRPVSPESIELHYLHTPF